MPLSGAGCKGCRGELAQARVWACRVVVDRPCLDDSARRGQAVEQVLVRAFVPAPDVEAFHDPVLPWFAGCDGVPQH